MLFPTTRVRSTVSQGHVRESGVKRVSLEAINYLYRWDKYTRMSDFVYKKGQEMLCRAPWPVFLVQFPVY